MIDCAFKLYDDIIVTSQKLFESGYRVEQNHSAGTWKMIPPRGGTMDGAVDEKMAWHDAAYHLRMAIYHINDGKELEEA